MEKSKKRNQILVLGAALFSMFFGAGNLIFPPHLGLLGGKKWLAAIIGFFLTGIGLPVVGVIASAKSDGDFQELGRRVSPTFSKIIGLVMVICIGPLLAVPRTGATAFEMGILPTFPNFNPVVFAVIYFGIAWLLVINPSNIIDKIGKILTPGLLILLTVIIFKGIIDPIGKPVDTGAVGAFEAGFTGGYQTMDALASVLFGGMVIQSLKDAGYDKVEDQVSMTMMAGLVSGIALTFVYGGLGYLGATASGVYSHDLTRVELTMDIAEHALKSFGKIGLGIVISLACLTTATGVASTVGGYFEDISKGKIKYSWAVTITIVISAILSVVGVEGIIELAGPLLEFIYPMVIVLIMFAIFIDEKHSDYIYKVSVLFTGIVSLLDAMSSFDIEFAANIVSKFPLSDMGLAWFVPAVVGAIIGSFIKDEKQKQVAAQ